MAAAGPQALVLSGEVDVLGADGGERRLLQRPIEPLRCLAGAPGRRLPADWSQGALRERGEALRPRPARAAPPPRGERTAPPCPPPPSEDRWPGPDKPSFRLRRTDTHVHDRVLAETEQKLWPLSPSTDRISLTAWRLAGLREAAFARSRVRFDRSGADRVVEAYPAAALLLWDLPRDGYKTDPAAREDLLAVLKERAPWLAWEPGAREACVESDDALDAVLCALIARAAALGLTEPPPAEAERLARVEGWIHLPRKACLGELPSDRHR